MAAPRKRKPDGRPQAAGSPARNAPRTAPQGSASRAAGAPEMVDPRWLLKALGVVLAVALLCAWGTLCLLWYQGQWQLVLHPSREVKATPAAGGLAFSDVHFGVDTTGQPQLDGWMVPASGSPAALTALVLHGGDGSMADVLPAVATLHRAGLRVLVFDYRGYGNSAGQHPTQDSMREDAASALSYITGDQHVAAEDIVLYGQGVGASLATELAAQHHDVRALILDAPEGDLTGRVLRDAHSWLVPVRLLFHEDFPLAASLHTLETP